MTSWEWAAFGILAYIAALGLLLRVLAFCREVPTPSPLTRNPNVKCVPRESA